MREKKNSQRDYPKLFIFEITTGETSETTPGEQDIGRNDLLPHCLQGSSEVAKRNEKRSKRYRTETMPLALKTREVLILNKNESKLSIERDSLSVITYTMYLPEN